MQVPVCMQVVNSNVNVWQKFQNIVATRNTFMKWHKVLTGYYAVKKKKIVVLSLGKPELRCWNVYNGSQWVNSLFYLSFTMDNHGHIKELEIYPLKGKGLSSL